MSNEKFVSFKNERDVGKKQIQITNTFHKTVGGKNTLISPEDLQQTYEKLKKDLDKKYGNYKIMVRGLNAVQWFSFKNFDDDNLNVEDEEEYFRNRVKDPSDHKFSHFSQIEISVIRNKTKEELKE
jgi:hypothetical protein